MFLVEHGGQDSAMVALGQPIAGSTGLSLSCLYGTSQIKRRINSLTPHLVLRLLRTKDVYECDWDEVKCKSGITIIEHADNIIHWSYHSVKLDAQLDKAWFSCIDRGYWTVTSTNYSWSVTQKIIRLIQLLPSFVWSVRNSMATVAYQISIEVLQLIGKSVKGSHSKKQIDRIGKKLFLVAVVYIFYVTTA